MEEYNIDNVLKRREKSKNIIENKSVQIVEYKKSKFTCFINFIKKLIWHK